MESSGWLVSTAGSWSGTSEGFFTGTWSATGSPVVGEMIESEQALTLLCPSYQWRAASLRLER
eukprot:2792901-Prymnesium_polylepis.1